MNKTLLAVKCAEYVNTHFQPKKHPREFPMVERSLRAMLSRSFVRGVQSLAEVMDNPQLVQLCDDVVSLNDSDLDTFTKTGTLPSGN